MNLSTRIVTIVVGLIALVGLIVGGFGLLVSQRLVSDSFALKTKELSDTLVALSRPDLYNLRVDRLNATIEQLLQQPSVEGLRIYRDDGLLLADGETYPDLSYIDSENASIQEAVRSGAAAAVTTSTQRIQAAPIHSPTGRLLGMAVVKLSRAREHYWLRQQRYRIVLFIGSLTILGGLLAAHFSQSLIGPLETLTKALQSNHNAFGPEFREVEEREDEIGRMARIYRRVETAREEHEHALMASKKALEKAKAEAEEATRAKSDFLANMSHEIRTPLNGLIGLNEILLQENPRPDQRNLLETAAVCGDGLMSVVNDLLDFSKIEAGRVRIHPEPADVVQIARDSLDLFASRLNERSLEGHLKIADAFPQWTLVDGSRLRQILQNLLSNAIKFTSVGTVTVDLDFERKGDTRADLICSVTDTGNGIEEKHLGRIFERFSQVDESAARLHGGTGLGLAICHRLVFLMGGKLSVESELGRGSTFQFRIPTDILPHPSPTTAPEKALEWVLPIDLGPILVVEDNAVNRRVVRLMFKHMGLDPIVVESGEAALEALKSEFFEVIFMDVQMPAMDGLETTRRIRALFEENGETQPYIVALTAYAQESDRDHCLKNGMNDFVAKPLKREDLHRLFARISAARPVA